MTPTEQDNELREEVKQILKDGFNYYIAERKDTSFDMKPLDIYCTEHLMQLITADRKRVALEARIDELEQVYPQLQKHHSVSGEGNYYYDDRIAELKAQQEEV